jgi:hypothetical protein
VVETPKAPLGLTSIKVSMNNSITELVLVESRSARTSQISNVSDERALETHRNRFQTLTGIETQSLF